MTPTVNPFFHDGIWLQLMIVHGWGKYHWLPNPSDWPIRYWEGYGWYHPMFNIDNGRCFFV